MSGLTYVYMPSIPGWVSPNRTPEPEPKPVSIPRHKKTAEYWFKFYMGEDLSEFEEPIPEPAPEPDSQLEPEEDDEYEDDEDLIVSWPMTPEEIDAWQNQPISELPPYYGSSGSSKESDDPQSAKADFAAEGLGGAALAACPPPPRTAHYHWPFPTRDTASINFAPIQTTTLTKPDKASPRRLTLRRYVTSITQPRGSSQHSALLLPTSAFSKAEERPPPNSTEREENRKPPSSHSSPQILCVSVVNSKTESP